MSLVKLGYYYISDEVDIQSNNNQQVIINTINTHSWIIAEKDLIFQKALIESTFLIPDGIGVVLAIRYLERKKIKKVAGFELHERILKLINEKKGSIFYLGSSSKTLEKITEKVKRKYPEILVNSLSPPFAKNFSEQQNNEIIATINKYTPDVLFVGMTAPKQEKWVNLNKNKILSNCIISIGAVFDFYAGTRKRPPKWMIDSGFEWLGRLFIDPFHLWKRNIISMPIFIFKMIILKYSCRHKKNSSLDKL